MRPGGKGSRAGGNYLCSDDARWGEAGGEGEKEVTSQLGGWGRIMPL
jgi:hypothetical protein